MSKQSKYSRKFLKKVIRKIAYRGKMPIKKARGILDHKANLNNVEYILRCFKIVPFEDECVQPNVVPHLVTISGTVYSLEMSPVFSFVERYTPKIASFLRDWVKALTKDIATEDIPKVSVTIYDKRSKVTAYAMVRPNQISELLK